jgi:hypothetical protein
VVLVCLLMCTVPLMGGLALLAAGWLRGSGWMIATGAVLAAVAGFYAAMMLVELPRPRLAYRDGQLLAYLLPGAPYSVPIEIVECFLLGKGLSMLPGKRNRNRESVTISIRLAERATDWHTRRTLPSLGGWCGGQITMNITLGCALVVFIVFNFYGLKEQGSAYIKHLAGPAWYLAWLVFPIELISLFVRPVTLAVRLMLNMAVDHLILGVFLALVAVLVPLPVMVLGCLIILIQTLVFTMLTCIYIALATEKEAH